MKKIWKKAICMFLSMCLGFSIIGYGSNVQASDKQKEIRKTAKNIEPEEWNQEEIKAYQFDSEEELVQYMLTGGMKYYNKKFQPANKMVKLVIADEGILFLEGSCESKSNMILYDAQKRKVSHNLDEYIHPVKVKKGDIFYIKFPKNMEEALIQAYVWKSNFSNLKNREEEFQEGKGTQTYHGFNIKRRSFVEINIAPLSSKGGTIYAFIQKKEHGTWTSVGKTNSINQKAKKGKGCFYGLEKGSYRLVLKSSVSQVAKVGYDRTSVKKSVAYKKSKAKNIKFKDIKENIYTTKEKASRWYKVSVKSVKKQKCLELFRAAEDGGFKFTVYQKGKKKALETKSVMGNKDKKIYLPKRKDTYYIKVSKIGKRTNGAYGIYFGNK